MAVQFGRARLLKKSSSAEWNHRMRKSKSKSGFRLAFDIYVSLPSCHPGRLNNAHYRHHIGSRHILHATSIQRPSGLRLYRDSQRPLCPPHCYVFFSHFMPPRAAAAREIRVWFNADVSERMPWDFRPTQEYVRVRPGQSTLVFFTAHNKSDKPVTGYSLYNVTPDKAAFYFNKIQCFCFEEQRLRGGETIDMPVFFYIDPEFATDWNCRNIDDITLSYMFHKVEEADENKDDDDGGQPTVVKLHSGPHPAAAVAAATPAPVAAPA
ncbi:hypothetical protein Vafri_19217 [Volvox africanus]|uniref:Uncharacterized protein n=1 Tax=Volvox africanus TaxID=51714 RepID=A0A8J4BNQ8_9CHLO|nr:hypothetical protein Vafri_19217 [Volvox africanus]